MLASEQETRQLRQLVSSSPQTSKATMFAIAAQSAVFAAVKPAAQRRQAVRASAAANASPADSLFDDAVPVQRDCAQTVCARPCLRPSFALFSSILFVLSRTQLCVQQSVCGRLPDMPMTRSMHRNAPADTPAPALRQRESSHAA